VEWQAAGSPRVCLSPEEHRRWRGEPAARVHASLWWGSSRQGRRQRYALLNANAMSTSMLVDGASRIQPFIWWWRGILEVLPSMHVSWACSYSEVGAEAGTKGGKEGETRAIWPRSTFQ